MWYVYIMKCRDSTLYTGVTTDIERRVKEHNHKKGSAYTRSRLPVTLVYTETHLNRSKALIREAKIKSWTRERKLVLIKAK